MLHVPLQPHHKRITSNDTTIVYEGPASDRYIYHEDVEDTYRTTEKGTIICRRILYDQGDLEEVDNTKIVMDWDKFNRHYARLEVLFMIVTATVVITTLVRLDLLTRQCYNDSRCREAHNYDKNHVEQLQLSCAFFSVLPVIVFYMKSYTGRVTLGTIITISGATPIVVWSHATAFLFYNIYVIPRRIEPDDERGPLAVYRRAWNFIFDLHIMMAGVWGLCRVINRMCMFLKYDGTVSISRESRRLPMSLEHKHLHRLQYGSEKI